MWCRQPGEVLIHPLVRALLDPGTPVAVLMCGVLEHLSDQDAVAAVGGWRDLLPLGSALVLAHVSASPVAGDPELAAGVEWAARVHGDHAGPHNPRSRAQVEELFAGWTPMRPGLTSVDRWQATALRYEVAFTADVRAGRSHEGGGPVPMLAGGGGTR